MVTVRNKHGTGGVRRHYFAVIANGERMNALLQLRAKEREAYARWLLNALPAMRGKLGYISQAIESDAGISFVRADTAEIIDARRDSGGDQSEGLTS